MVDRYGKWHVKNQSEIKMLYWQVKNHNDHKAKQFKNRKRKLDEHHIGGTYCAYLVAHQFCAIELASLLVLV